MKTADAMVASTPEVTCVQGHTTLSHATWSKGRDSSEGVVQALSEQLKQALHACGEAESQVATLEGKLAIAESEAASLQRQVAVSKRQQASFSDDHEHLQSSR